MPPGKDIDDFFTLLRSRLLLLRYKLSKEARERFFTEFLPLLHDTKTRVLRENDDNSWYLVYIGTKPGSRGKGFAKALIQHTTSQVNMVLSPFPRVPIAPLCFLQNRSNRP